MWTDRCGRVQPVSDLFSHPVLSIGMTTWRRHHGDKFVAHVGHDEISGLYVWWSGAKGTNSP